MLMQVLQGMHEIYRNEFKSDFPPDTINLHCYLSFVMLMQVLQGMHEIHKNEYKSDFPPDTEQ